MKYVILFLSFLLIGCGCKQDMIIKNRDKNVTIPLEYFSYIHVGPFVLVDDNKTKWRLHVNNLKTSHESCTKQMDILKERYGN